jgi:hypothetical protein
MRKFLSVEGCGFYLEWVGSAFTMSCAKGGDLAKLVSDH